MNERQRRAYENPATDAAMVDLSDRTYLRFKGAVWSTLLSVNK